MLRSEADFVLLDNCDSVTAMVAALKARPPQVALVDIGEDAAAGVSALASMVTVAPQTAVIAGGVASVQVFAALRAGAVGFLQSEFATAAEWCAAIREAHSGGAPLARESARQVVASFVTRETRWDMLSARELQVLAGLADQLTYRGVAQRLGISEDTVRAHVRALYRKLGVQSRTAAVQKYLEHEGASGGEPVAVSAC